MRLRWVSSYFPDNLNVHSTEANPSIQPALQVLSLPVSNMVILATEVNGRRDRFPRAAMASPS